MAGFPAYRCDAARALFEPLTRGLEGRAERVLIGLNWTYVEGPAGVGLCHTPVRPSSGCVGVEGAAALQGRALADLAGGLMGDDAFLRSLAVAAINAHHNRPELAGSAVNGFDLLEPPGADTVVIGRFPGLAARLPEAAVIERAPKPGDHPLEAAPVLLPRAKQVAITSSTLANGTLPRLLALVPESAFCVLVGPTTPLAPALFAHRISALSGLVVTDRAGAFRAIAEGGAVAALRPVSRRLTLAAPR